LLPHCSGVCRVAGHLFVRGGRSGARDPGERAGHATRAGEVLYAAEAGLAEGLRRKQLAVEEPDAAGREQPAHVLGIGEALAERHVDALERHAAHRVPAQVAGRPAHPPLRVDAPHALHVACRADRKLAVARADLHEHRSRREYTLQELEFLVCFRMPGAHYQQMPSYTPATLRESLTRTKSITVWCSPMRPGTSANSGAALPMTMVCACARTSSIVGTISREI